MAGTGWFSSGTGDSVSATWDGKDASGKQVAPGTYTATLAAQTSDGTCIGGDSDIKSIPITVTAAEVEYRVELANPWIENFCPISSQVKFGSSANLLNGNLSLSQSLFKLSNSKFLGEFTLSYNSLDGEIGVLGTGWTHTYNVRLVANNGGSYTVTEGDGKRIVLYSNEPIYTPENSNFPALTLNPDQTYTLEYENGLQYHFGQNMEITSISDRNSKTTTYTYDVNALTITDPNGRKIAIHYVDNKIETITDPMGNEHIFSYHPNQELKEVSSQIAGVVGWRTWSYAYWEGAFAFLKTSTVKVGQNEDITQYSYDPAHRVNQVIDPDSKTRTITYTPSQNLTQLTEKDGGIWKFKYDANRITEKEDPLGNKVTYSYYPDSPPGNLKAGKLESVRDPRLKYIRYTYWDNGNLKTVEDERGATTLTTTYYFEKSSYSDLLTKIEYPGTPTPVELDYDEFGNLKYFKDPMGNETHYTYENGEIKTLETKRLLESPLVKLTFSFDPDHYYLKSVTNDRNQEIMNLDEYDNAGNPMLVKDWHLPSNTANETNLVYNGFNQIASVTDPEGKVILFSYYPDGNLSKITDGNSKKTTYEYNYRGQVKKITNALPSYNQTEFTYGTGCPSCGTGVEKLTSVKDAYGRLTTFEYDQTGRLKKEQDPLGNYKEYNYDYFFSNNKITVIDERGISVDYYYDNLNRLKEVKYQGTLMKSFGYDDRNNLVSANSPSINHTLTLGYDLNNRLTDVSDSNGSVHYEYDAINGRTLMTTPDGRSLAYEYEERNRVKKITSTPGPTLMISYYDDPQRRMTVSYPNSTSREYSYNKAGFLTSLVNKRGPEVISSYSYTPDGVYNRITMTDLSGLHEYDYDEIYQLKQATHPISPPVEGFAYDAVGNRTTATIEADFSLLKAHNYTYDWENKLVKVEYAYPGMANGFKAEYQYDALGRRIGKNVNDVITRYVYDGANIIAEYDGSGSLSAKYYHNLIMDDPMAMEQGGSTYYYHKDGLGSITDITDASGTIVRSYTYKSFGEVYTPSWGLVQPYMYTGREYDPESGLYYYRARYYDPKEGRFLTKDPIGFAGGDVNLYRYLGNNSINWIDPWGIFRYAPGAGQPVDERTAEALTCFENCIGREIIVTGARETGPPHVPGSAHETGQACDIGKISNPGLYRFDVEQCFTHCIGRYGFVWGYEGIGHFHFQTRPGKGGATDFTPGIR